MLEVGIRERKGGRERDWKWGIGGGKKGRGRCEMEIG